MLLESLLNSSLNRQETRGVAITLVTHMFAQNTALIDGIARDSIVETPLFSEETEETGGCCPTLSYCHTYVSIFLSIFRV